MPDMRQDHLAFDRASARRIDEDGHLHVERSHITKANVCPYLGREIPDHERLGLKPDHVYQLYRDPSEIAKAAPTFNGKPLLSLHRPQTAAAHSHSLTVGTVNNAIWEEPFLDADLTIWDAAAIAGIESDDQRQLSASYRYDADMTPGEAGGVSYDGRMVNLRGNHVALVEKGRAGPDVMVGDAALPDATHGARPAWRSLSPVRVPSPWGRSRFTSTPSWRRMLPSTFRRS